MLKEESASISLVHFYPTLISINGVLPHFLLIALLGRLSQERVTGPRLTRELYCRGETGTRVAQIVVQHLNYYTLDFTVNECLKRAVYKMLH